MRLFHAFVALLGVSATLVIAAPLQSSHPTINVNEVFTVSRDIKPLERPLSTTKYRPRTRFRSVAERHFRKRADEKKKEGKSKKPKSKDFHHHNLTNTGGDANSGVVDESGGTKPVGGIASDGAGPESKEIQHHADNEDSDGESGGGRKSRKKVKKPKKKAPKQKKPKRKGGNRKGGDETGSDDDPGTDNASENENGTDNDEE